MGKPRWEFLSGQSHWEGFSQFLLVGGPGTLMLLLIVPLIIAGNIFFILCSSVSQAPRAFAIADIALASSGLAFFSRAKISMYKQGRWLTFGSSEMTPTNRLFYRLGYALIISSALISLAILAIAEGPKFLSIAKP